MKRFRSRAGSTFRAGFTAGQILAGIIIGGTGLGIAGAAAVQVMKAGGSANATIENRQAIRATAQALAVETVQLTTASLGREGSFATVNLDSASTTAVADNIQARPAGTLTPTGSTRTGKTQWVPTPPTGGGGIPTNSAVRGSDAYGRPFGYCSWRHQGSAAAGQLAGRTTDVTTAPLFVLISAGQDGIFQTSCNDAATRVKLGDDEIEVITQTQAVEMATVFRQMSGQQGSADIQNRSLAVKKLAPAMTLDVAGNARVSDAASSQSATIEGNATAASVTTTTSLAAGAVEGAAATIATTRSSTGNLTLRETATPPDCSQPGANGTMRFTAQNGVEICMDGNWAPPGGTGGLTVNAPFAPVTGAQPNTTYTSNAIWMANFPANTAAVMSVSGASGATGLQIIKNGTPAGSSTTIDPFSQIALRLTTGPSNYSQTYTATLTIGNSSVTWSVTVMAPPALTISASPTTITEGNATTVTITVPVAIPDPLTVNWGVTGGTATATTDFTPSSGTVSVPANFTGTRTFTINTVQDSGLEADETIILAILPGTNYAQGTPSSLTLTIWDEDSPWASSAWGACSNQCGSGTETRTNSCPAGAGRCAGQPVPATSQSCYAVAACTYAWQTTAWGACSGDGTWSSGAWGACSGDASWSSGSWGSCSGDGSWQSSSWGSCSASCGGGTQTRSNTCTATTGTQTRTVSCPATTGTQTRTNTCNATTGTQTRTVSCLRSDGQTVPDAQCNAATRPAASQSCTGSCGTQPATSQSCTGTCSATQPATSQSCTGTCSATQPATSQSCNTQSCCTPSNQVTSYGSCSASCGGGTQTVYWSDGCGSTWTTSQSCNTQACCCKTCWELVGWDDHGSMGQCNYQCSTWDWGTHCEYTNAYCHGYEIYENECGGTKSKYVKWCGC